MKRIYLLLASVIFTINANSQAPDWSWANGIGSVGSDAGNSITVDADGNIYTTGFFVSTVDFDPGAGVFNLTSSHPNISDIFVSKTDSAGNFVWAKAFGGQALDVGRSIAFDPSGTGAIYFSGNFVGTSDFDPSAVVFNLTSSTPIYSDVFICKLDTAGNFIWAKGMGGSEDDISYSMSVDPSGSGNIYCSGNFRGLADFDPDAGVFNLTAIGNTDIFVAKYNSSGNLIWAKEIGGNGYDQSIFIARGQSGTDIITTGYFSGMVDFDPGAGSSNLTSVGGDDIFISKLDSAGNFVWAKNFGGTAGDYGTSVTTDVAGNVYTTGRFAGQVDFDPGAGVFNVISWGGDDAFISKLDNAGNFVWAKGIGSGTYETSTDIVVDNSGNVLTIGGFQNTIDFDPGVGVFNLTAAGNIDIFISCLDSTGNFVWAKQTGGLNGDNCKAIVLDALGHLIMTGTFSSSTILFGSTTLTCGGQSDMFISKLDTPTPTGIETISNDQFPVNIFPNPFTDELTVNCTIQGEIIICDVTGRVVYNEKLTSINAQQITANWHKGIYFVEVITDAGTVVKKVVKY